VFYPGKLFKYLSCGVTALSNVDGKGKTPFSGVTELALGSPIVEYS
jgi:hypothetical protein